MLHAHIPDGFFDFGESGLDGEACALIIERLDDDVCARFLGVSLVGFEFAETTAAHEIRTAGQIALTLAQMVPDKRLCKVFTDRAKAMVMVHDISDIIKEVIVATTETDPVLKAQCAVNLKAYDQTITPFVYQLALFAKAEKNDALFHDTVTALRGQTLQPGHYSRALSMEEANAFCLNAVQYANDYATQFARHANWNRPDHLEKVSVMTDYFNEVENASSFGGLQCQVHEKCDGSDYQNTVLAYRQMTGSLSLQYGNGGLQTNRLNGRFEKHLNRLYYQAPLPAMVLGTMQYCYGTARTAYLLAKDFLCVDERVPEPVLNDPPILHEEFVRRQQTFFAAGKSPPGLRRNTEIAALYGDALDDLNERRILWLPEAGKTLVDSHAIEKIHLA